MPVSQSAVLDALRGVRDPDLHKDIVTLGFVKNLVVDGARVAFTIELTTPACPVKDQMRDQAHALVSGLPGVADVQDRDDGRRSHLGRRRGQPSARRRRQKRHRGWRGKRRAWARPPSP